MKHLGLWLAVPVALVFVADGAQATNLCGDYVGGATIPIPERPGAILCQTPEHPGIGGVCDLSCNGDGQVCVVTNTNPIDQFNVCWDTDGDGDDDQCVGPCTGQCVVPKFLLPPEQRVDAFVHIPGTTGTICAADP